MPTYAYECKSCQIVFEEFHSMSETVNTCKRCGSSVKRIISKSLNVKKNNNFKREKVGSVVKQYIENVKEELKVEKKRVSSTEYEAK
tara:strand:- start:1637 stop:1897 length:261 start_codon:yes stop_codon:yes gene_type:complete